MSKSSIFRKRIYLTNVEMLYMWILFFSFSTKGIKFETWNCPSWTHLQMSGVPNYAMFVTWRALKFRFSTNKGSKTFHKTLPKSLCINHHYNKNLKVIWKSIPKFCLSFSSLVFVITFSGCNMARSLSTAMMSTA